MMGSKGLDGHVTIFCGVPLTALAEPTAHMSTTAPAATAPSCARQGMRRSFVRPARLVPSPTRFGMSQK